MVKMILLLFERCTTDFVSGIVYVEGRGCEIFQSDGTAA